MPARVAQNPDSTEWVHGDGSNRQPDEAGARICAAAILRDVTERNVHARSSAASEALFRAAFENAPIGMALVTPDERTLRVNRALCQMLGYSEEELLASSLRRLTHPDDVAGNQQFVAQALGGEIDTYDLEKRYLRKDGQVVWAHLNVSLVRDEAGEPLYFISQMQDVTERRRLLDELAASEATYRTLVEQLPVVFYQLANDEAQTPLYFSPTIADLLRSTPERLAERAEHWLAYVHPEDRERVVRDDAAQEPGAESERFSSEYRLQRDDGTYVWVRDECVPVSDEAGEVVAWQGMLLDITDRVEAEEAQARLAAIIEGAEDAIISRTLDGTITSWNRGAERLYGYRADEMIGQSITRIFPERLGADALTHKEDFYARPAYFETTRLRQDGTPVEVAVALSPIRDRNGRVTGLASISRDVTERNRAAGELRQALEDARAGIRAKDLFLAMMSHELRTPLQAVLGYADFLLRGASGPLTAEQREDIGYIHQGASRMVALFDQMLDLSRLEAGRLEIASKPVDLAEVIEQVRQDVAPEVAAKGLQLVIDLEPGVPPALGDPMRLRQIILNLVNNAIKFTEAGTVRVAARPAADGVEVTVADTGIGIPHEALAHIFEEFRQVDGNLTRRHGGAGLGLAICKRLAEQMGGRITVQSRPGAGSTFTLWLQAARPQSKRNSPQTSRAVG